MRVSERGDVVSTAHRAGARGPRIAHGPERGARRLGVAAATMGAWLLGCASVPTLHRGAPQQTVHSELLRVMAADGYTCTDSPDRSTLVCTHADLIDLSIAYLPQSNTLQIFSGFNRVQDATMADKWRGTCDDLVAEANTINAGYVSKVTCEGEFLYFTHYAWVPDTGLVDADLRAMLQVIRDSISSTIQAAGMVKSAEGGSGGGAEGGVVGGVTGEVDGEQSAEPAPAPAGSVPST